MSAIWIELYNVNGNYVKIVKYIFEKTIFKYSFLPTKKISLKIKPKLFFIFTF